MLCPQCLYLWDESLSFNLAKCFSHKHRILSFSIRRTSTIFSMCVRWVLPATKYIRCRTLYSFICSKIINRWEQFNFILLTCVALSLARRLCALVCRSLYQMEILSVDMRGIFNFISPSSLAGAKQPSAI